MRGDVQDTGSGWTIRLCGPVTVEAAERQGDARPPGRQGRLLLAYLALNRDRPCSRGELIDLLWPEAPPAAADTALSALLSKLRRVLGSGALVGRSNVRLVAPGAVTVDVEEAARAARRAEAALQDGAWRSAETAARQALTADPAAFLPDCDGSWVRDQRASLEVLRVRALEVLAEACLRAGELGEAEDAARAAVAAAPFRESSHRLLMEVHEAAGNPAEALRVFEDLRRLLREELGTAPGPAAMAVHERMLRGGAPAVRRPARVPGTAPVGPGARRWPAPLEALRSRHAFVGRADEAAFLESCWRRAAAGSRGLVVLAGDAGIGKTRLAAELAHHAHADGALVLYGRFDEDAPAPYKPVVELLRGWAGGASLAPVAARLGGRAGDLGIVLPELGPAPAEPEVGGEPLRTGEADARRLRLFDALAALLAEIAGAAPLLVVLDDIHWADHPTLQLIGHLVRAPAPERVLFVATMRDAETDEPLARLLAALRREGTLQQLALGGLDVRETGALVAALGGRPADDGFLATLHDETEGNPFFIEEVVRHLADREGRLGGAVALHEAGVPAGVREITARRLARLSGPARQALATAAVIGREFDYDVLETIGPVTGDDLVDALEEAVEDGVLREDPERVGRYAFAHVLVRATLYDSLSALRRARLHGKVGEALIDRRGAQLDAHLGQLAHHFALAAPAAGPERAVDFALAAGRRADQLLAWEEAADHYAAALRARDQAGTAQDRLRCELLLALGTSQERAGSPDARATFAAAAATARALRDPALLGRAALGFAGRWSQLGRVSEEVAALLQEALAELGEEQSPLRARLLARLALELYYAADTSRRLALSDEAVTLARGLGDPLTLATCLDARHYALWRPETVHERLDVAEELRGIAAVDRRPRARAGRRGLDRGRPARARRRDGRGRADRRRLAARGGAAPAALPVVDVGLPVHAGAARRGLRARRAAGAGGARDRPARRGRERDARVRAVHVQHPPRAGPAGRGRGGGARLRLAVPGGAGVALRAGPAARRSRARGGGARAGRDARRPRLRGAAARRQLADRGDAARRGLRAPRRRAARAGALRAAPALRRAQRRRRARDGVQRLGLPPARHARRDLRATSPRRSATSATPWP